jgi:hypothetical protein
MAIKQTPGATVSGESAGQLPCSVRALPHLSDYSLRGGSLELSFALMDFHALAWTALLRIEVLDEIDPPLRQRLAGDALAIGAQPFGDQLQRAPKANLCRTHHSHRGPPSS